MGRGLQQHKMGLCPPIECRAATRASVPANARRQEGVDRRLRQRADVGRAEALEGQLCTFPPTGPTPNLGPGGTVYNCPAPDVAIATTPPWHPDPERQGHRPSRLSRAMREPMRGRKSSRAPRRRPGIRGGQGEERQERNQAGGRGGATFIEQGRLRPRTAVVERGGRPQHIADATDRMTVIAPHHSCDKTVTTIKKATAAGTGVRQARPPRASSPRCWCPRTCDPGSAFQARRPRT